MADENANQLGEDETLYDGEELGEGDQQYGDEIPIDAETDAGTAAAAEQAELEAMKKKLKEMEEESAKLKALQAGGSAEGGGGSGGAVEIGSKEEADSRSIYVGGVDYSCTPEELQQHFKACGTVNRVTILTDRTGTPKGYAYVEFLEVDAVSNAILLDNTDLRGRSLKVSQKRTNVPGLKASRGRGRGRGGFTPYGRGGFMPPPYMMPYGMPYAPPPYGGGRGRGGFAPRGRGRGRFYAPY